MGHAGADTSDADATIYGSGVRCFWLWLAFYLLFSFYTAVLYCYPNASS
jgi:hypothetical protein